jgi:hypothetical protein
MLVVGHALAIRLAGIRMVSVLGLDKTAADGGCAGRGPAGRFDRAVRAELA